MIDTKNLSNIGIGAWGLGGFAERDENNNDERQINALVHSIKRGMNFIEINFWNSKGKSVELLAEAIRQSKIKRENLFYSLVIYNYYLPTLKDAEKEIIQYFDLFQTDYMDSLEFTMPNFKLYGFDESCKFISGYISKSKARYTSLTNCNLEMLKKYHKVFGNKLFSHELHFSFEIRDNEDMGITDYASKHNILNFIYQPLRRNRTAKRNWPLLKELSKKYGKTQNQLILNWMNWKGFKPYIKSESIEHINENIDSFDFQMEETDYKKIDDFRIPNYKIPNIDWWQEGKIGEKIHMLPNVIDDVLDGKYEYRK